jgi:hypothetical protein
MYQSFSMVDQTLLSSISSTILMIFILQAGIHEVKVFPKFHSFNNKSIYICGDHCQDTLESSVFVCLLLL